MNYDRMWAVADAIEKNPDHFDMDDFINREGDIVLMLSQPGALASCGTTGCIAGWAIHLYPSVAKQVDTGLMSVSQIAGEVLGLDYDTACDLFYLFELGTAEQAAGHIRGMVIADMERSVNQERNSQQ